MPPKFAQTKKTAVTAKHGGNIMQDIQKLAVPFGILLAKKGLDAAISKDTKKNAKANANANTNTNTKAKTGGSKAKMVRKDMDNLSNEIERYLSKY